MEDLVENFNSDSDDNSVPLYSLSFKKKDYEIFKII